MLTLMATGLRPTSYKEPLLTGTLITDMLVQHMSAGSRAENVGVFDHFLLSGQFSKCQEH